MCMTQIKELESKRSEILGKIRDHMEYMNNLGSLDEMKQYLGRCLLQFDQYDELSGVIMDLLLFKLYEQTQNTVKFSELKDVLKVRKSELV
jgi:hypothetical protein